MLLLIETIPSELKCGLPRVSFFSLKSFQLHEPHREITIPFLHAKQTATAFLGTHKERQFTESGVVAW